MLDFATISNFGQDALKLMSSQARNVYTVSSQYMGRAIVWINNNAPTVAQSALDSSKKVVNLATPYLASFVDFAKSSAGTVASFASKNLTNIGIAGACAAGVATIALVFKRFSQAKPTADAEVVYQAPSPRLEASASGESAASALAPTGTAANTLLHDV